MEFQEKMLLRFRDLYLTARLTYNDFGNEQWTHSKWWNWRTLWLWSLFVAYFFSDQNSTQILEEFSLLLLFSDKKNLIRNTICVSDRNDSKMTNTILVEILFRKERMHLNYSRILIGILTGILLGKAGLTQPTLYSCPWFRFIVCLDFKWNLRWRERWNVCFSLQKGAGVAFQSSPCGSFPLYVLLPMSTF